MDLANIFKPHHLNWFDFSYSTDFDTIAELPGTLQDGISKAIDHFSQQVDAAVAKMSEVEQNEYLDFVSDRHWELSTEYPLLMRRALLMVTYSKTEYSLHRLCEAAHLDGKCSVPNPDDVYLPLSESYIKNQLAITDASLEPNWQYLNAIRLMRNTFVHSDGHLSADENSQKIRQFLSVQPDLGIEVDDFGFMKLGSNTITIVAQHSRGFISELLRRINAITTL